MINECSVILILSDSNSFTIIIVKLQLNKNYYLAHLDDNTIKMHNCKFLMLHKAMSYSSILKRDVSELGCFKDTGVRAMPDYWIANGYMTRELCIENCAEQVCYSLSQ